MPRFGIIRLALVLIAAQIGSIASPEHSWSAEAFHPDGDAGRRGRADEAKSQERRDEDTISKSRESWRGQDLTNRPKREFRDGAALEAKMEAQAKSSEWKTSQADHAWDQRGNSEFTKMGISDARQLQNFAEDIRQKSDIKKELINDRTAYGRLNEKGSDRGIIVIDNPRAENGGTIMTTKKLNERMDGLK